MTYYINYIYGSPALVSKHPCVTLKKQITSDDPNILSQIVCRFNNSLKDSQIRRKRLLRAPIRVEDAITTLNLTSALYL